MRCPVAQLMPGQKPAVTPPSSASASSADAPWIHQLDFHYDMEIPISVTRLQLTFDVLNLINLINCDAGLLRYVTNGTYTPVSWSGTDAATGKPIYTVSSAANLKDGSAYSTQTIRSRWQMKLGARLSF